MRLRGRVGRYCVYEEMSLKVGPALRIRSTTCLFLLGGSCRGSADVSHPPLPISGPLPDLTSSWSTPFAPPPLREPRKGQPHCWPFHSRNPIECVGSNLNPIVESWPMAWRWNKLVTEPVGKSWGCRWGFQVFRLDCGTLPRQPT